MHVSEMSSTKKSIFKCIKYVAPRAATAVFNKTRTGGLMLHAAEEIDEELPKDEHGYISTHKGDSGSPFWVNKYITQKLETGDVEGSKELKEYRAILVAIHSQSTSLSYPENMASYIKDNENQCRSDAVKMTGDILQWIKDKSKFFEEE